MPARHRHTRSHTVALVIGGTAGALLRYAVATSWPQPTQLWVSTTMTAAVAFAIAGFLVSSGITSAVRAAVFGVCASAASLSAWSVLTIKQPPTLSLAFLIGVPAAALAGLLCGLLAARVVAR
ncbi:chromosome condensation protein CrcB [Mycolicibacterium sp. 018/SC-01/001]|uniref:chromosome condensation protein CrcB n=1 Tax=Mycolicibacterium sp. 018/SC-01/001 TaxID=2592069 RepID=UPI00117E7144|nr:chromosome condensation protein CrcB [Mycolicibacterium sp. 018/SC-01/001]TRW80477.1 chromosome condensation protein CrcB [Mycolicibacterium sp. 018/SC-01/001]